MAESNVKGVNTSKAQHELATGKVKIAKKIREELIKELTNYVKNIKATDAITTGDFNEDYFLKNVQDFIIETGLFDV